MKKNNKNGWNGKVDFTYGTGSYWVRKENLPTIRPQCTITPKINPSVFLNYRKDKVNIFLQADNLYTETLNKNEFVTRTYDNGAIINSQLKRNRKYKLSHLKSRNRLEYRCSKYIDHFRIVWK